MTIAVKVTTACGNSWVTRINATLEEARSYFMGARFENADETLMGPVKRVERVDAEEVYCPATECAELAQEGEEAQA